MYSTNGRVWNSFQFKDDVIFVVETWTPHFKSSMLTKHQGWHHPYNEFSSLLLILCEMRATSVSLKSLAYKYPWIWIFKKLSGTMHFNHWQNVREVLHTAIKWFLVLTIGTLSVQNPTKMWRFDHRRKKWLNWAKNYAYTIFTYSNLE